MGIKKLIKLFVFVSVFTMVFATVVVSAKSKPALVPNELGTTSDDDVFSSDLILGNRSGAREVSGSTAVDKAISKLEKSANYWGWKLKRTGKTKILPNKVLVATVNLSNSKYEFKGVEARVTSKRTTYAYGGYKYTLKSWTNTLKQYSVKSDLKKVTVDKAKSAAKSLKKTGSANSWQCKESSRYKKNSAYVTLNFTNKTYAFKVEVIATRKNGKIAVTYKASGVKTSKAWIEKCLKTYRDPIISSPIPLTPTLGSAGTSAGLITLIPDGDNVIESVPDEASFGSAAPDMATESAPETDTLVLDSVDNSEGAIDESVEELVLLDGSAPAEEPLDLNLDLID